MFEAGNPARRLLLISNSTLYGSGYLDHVAGEISSFLGGIKRVLFIPYALYDRDAYAALACERFKAMGYGLKSIHESSNAPQAVMDADVVFIGGGNTFRLLKCLYDFEVMPAIRQKVAQGIPYIGSSAGANVSCPTIKTTKDMPIVQPPSFDALGLISFQISPHYQDPDPNSTHMGETQEERINQFLEENDTSVVGLREGGLLHVVGKEITLKGVAGARIFRKDHKPIEIEPGAKLNHLI